MFFRTSYGIFLFKNLSSFFILKENISGQMDGHNVFILVTQKDCSFTSRMQSQRIKKIKKIKRLYLYTMWRKCNYYLYLN